ncbi:TolC family protein [Arcobacter sp. LA11]|uniref:TolC family protein n=1 Tax=Arcobacter sp. LA11 TaxID=1898176 RepID=UPI000933689E|nr:TolC family protein [Arcobacter sp. LA11]
MKRILFVIFILSSTVFSRELVLTLDEAIDLALKNNALNRISKLNLEIANAQYQQALSSNYPSLDAVFYASRDKNDTIFQQRGVFTLSSDLTKTLALANTLNIPEDAPGILTTRTATQAVISGTPSSSFPSGEISADIDTKAKGRDTARGQLELNYPIYTGGKLSAIIEQARLNKSIMKQSIVRDENSIVFDVKKYYYGYVLTSELSKLVNKIYDNMKFSTELAKEFLENGSDLKINKTDYLNAKLTTSLIQSTLAKIELNKKMLEGAISNLVGLKYSDNLKIVYDNQSILKQNKSLQELIKKSYDLNPDMNSINLALKIKKQQIKEADSNNYPMVNLFGNVSKTYNSYEYGYLNEDNENSWSIGVALKLSLFDGFKTKNKVIEKKIDKKIVEEQKVLLEEGLALQLKNEFIKSSIGYKQIEILKDAVKTASENSRMNFKGFQYEMIEAKELIQSQLIEVYVKADHLKYIHDYLVSLATIDKLVGTKIDEKF